MLTVYLVVHAIVNCYWLLCCECVLALIIFVVSKSVRCHGYLLGNSTQLLVELFYFHEPLEGAQIL